MENGLDALVVTQITERLFKTESNVLFFGNKLPNNHVFWTQICLIFEETDYGPASKRLSYKCFSAQLE